MKRLCVPPIAKSGFCITALLIVLLLLEFCCNPTSLQIGLLFVYYPFFFGTLAVILLATPLCITVICSFANEKVGKCAKTIGGIVFALCATPFFTALFVVWLIILSHASIGTAILIFIAFLAVFFFLFHAIPAFSVAVGNILLSIPLFLYASFYWENPFECVKWFDLFKSNPPTDVSTAETAQNYCFLAGIFCAISFFVLFLCLYKIRKPGKKYPVSTRILAMILSGISFLQALGALQSVILYIRAFGYTPMRIYGLIAASGMLLLFLGVILKIHLPERSRHVQRISDAERLQL